jgi:hypothetical protein
MAGDVPDVIEAVAIRARHIDDDEVRRFTRDGFEQRLPFLQPDDRCGAGDAEIRSTMRARSGSASASRTFNLTHQQAPALSR